MKKSDIVTDTIPTDQGVMLLNFKIDRAAALAEGFILQRGVNDALPADEIELPAYVRTLGINVLRMLTMTLQHQQQKKGAIDAVAHYPDGTSERITLRIPAVKHAAEMLRHHALKVHRAWDAHQKKEEMEAADAARRKKLLEPWLKDKVEREMYRAGVLSPDVLRRRVDEEIKGVINAALLNVKAPARPACHTVTNIRAGDASVDFMTPRDYVLMKALTKALPSNYKVAVLHKYYDEELDANRFNPRAGNVEESVWLHVTVKTPDERTRIFRVCAVYVKKPNAIH